MFKKLMGIEIIEDKLEIIENNLSMAFELGTETSKRAIELEDEVKEIKITLDLLIKLLTKGN